MAMENKRITQLSTERQTLTSGDYVMVDDADNGSAKYRLDRLKETDSTLSVSGKAADAAATGQAISNEAEARNNADTALGNDVDDLKSAFTQLKDFGYVSTLSNGSAAWAGHPNYVCTDYIEVEFESAIILNVLRANTSGYVYVYNINAYNGSKTLIGQLENLTSPIFFSDSDAVKYIRIEFTEKDEDTLTTVNPLRVTDFNKNDVAVVSCLNDKIDFILNQINGINDIYIPKFEQGTLNNGSNANYVRTADYIPVKPNHFFTIKPTFDLTGKEIRIGYKLYDSTKTQIAEVEPPVTLSDINISYPNAAYIKFCYAIYNESTSSYLTLRYYLPKFTDIICYSTDIRLDGVIKKNNDTHDIICTLSNGSVPNPGNANAVNTSNYIPVSFGDTVELVVYKSLEAGQHYSIAPYWYDANMSYINGIDLGSNVLINRKYIDSSAIAYVRFGICVYDSGGNAVSRRVKDYSYGDVVAIINRKRRDIFSSAPYDDSYDWETCSSGFNSLLASAGECDNFAFFTDQHIMGKKGTYDYGNVATYLSKMQKVVNATPCQFVVSGGDWLNNGDTPAQALNKLSFITGACNALFKRFYSMVGNHDTNSQGTTALTQQAITNAMQVDFKDSYYSFDGRYAKYYVFDSGDDDGGSLNSYRNEQIAWFAHSLKVDNPAHATILIHIIYDNYSRSQTITAFASKIGDVISAFNSHSAITFDGVTYDFSDCTGTVDYILAGHTHQDLETTVGGVPCVLTKNFGVLAFGKNPTYDIVNADYTNNVVTFYRVGDGITRTINI